jgi:hypothetical protein
MVLARPPKSGVTLTESSGGHAVASSRCPGPTAALWATRNAAHMVTWLAVNTGLPSSRSSGAMRSYVARLVQLTKHGIGVACVGASLRPTGQRQLPPTAGDSTLNCSCVTAGADQPKDRSVVVIPGYGPLPG